MPKLNKRQPKYLKKSGCNVGYFWCDKRRIYLPGKYNSPESLAAYHKAMSDLSAQKAESGSSVVFRGISASDGLTVAELVARFLQWGERYYVKNGEPTGALEQYAYATRLLYRTR